MYTPYHCKVFPIQPKPKGKRQQRVMKRICNHCYALACFLQSKMLSRGELSICTNKNRRLNSLGGQTGTPFTIPLVHI